MDLEGAGAIGLSLPRPAEHSPTSLPLIAFRFYDSRLRSNFSVSHRGHSTAKLQPEVIGRRLTQIDTDKVLKKNLNKIFRN